MSDDDTINSLRRQIAELQLSREFLCGKWSDASFALEKAKKEIEELRLQNATLLYLNRDGYV